MSRPGNVLGRSPDGSFLIRVPRRHEQATSLSKQHRPTSKQATPTAAPAVPSPSQAPTKPAPSTTPKARTRGPAKAAPKPAAPAPSPAPEPVSQTSASSTEQGEQHRPTVAERMQRDAELARLMKAAPPAPNPAARALADRVDRQAPDVRVPAPTAQDVARFVDNLDASAGVLGGGCAFCGVDHVTVSAAKARRLCGQRGAMRGVWALRRLTLSNLGGRPSPDRPLGWLCPVCEDRAAQERGANLAAMEQALADHLTASGNSQRAAQIRTQGTTGLVAWAALVDRERRAGRPEPGPNRQPWEHVRL